MEVDESRMPSESAEEMVRRLAETKVRAATEVFGGRGSALVIGADTIVEIDGDVLGKPGSAAAAKEMLRKLNGKSHRVLSGIAVMRLPDAVLRTAVETTKVHFVSMSDSEIEDYSATREPLDKAGGYAIQGVGGRYIDRIEGCYFNVVGLPLARLYRMLREMGWGQNQD